MQDEFDLKDHEAAEEQLLAVQRTIRFSLSEFPVEVLVEKMPSGEEDHESEFFIPPYQRNFTWEEYRQCKFIESVLMGLPIPFLFGYIDPELDDRTVLVDGVQRLSTLKRFMEGNLALKELGRLDALNGFKYSDLSQLQQRRFGRRTLRMIVLDDADPETQFELFERINTTSKKPEPAEIRRGAFAGPFRDLIVEFSENEIFKALTPLGETRVRQREREELVARLFCYADKMGEFKHDVAAFINRYVKSMNQDLSDNPEKIDAIRDEFRTFCAESERVLPELGFGISQNQTPRNRFEALSVGIMLELRSGTRLPDLSGWVDADGEFREITRSGGSNSPRKLAERINYVRAKISRGER